jgi:hypothetical protein
MSGLVDSVPSVSMFSAKRVLHAYFWSQKYRWASEACKNCRSAGRSSTMVNFSAALFKEVQRLVFFVCNDLYHASDPKTEVAGFAFLAELFYGKSNDPDSIAVVQPFFAGEDDFSDAFTSEFVTTGSITEPKRALKDKLTRSPGGSGKSFCWA